jgi:hypothetical protein
MFEANILPSLPAAFFCVFIAHRTSKKAEKGFRLIKLFYRPTGELAEEVGLEF